MFQARYRPIFELIHDDLLMKYLSVTLMSVETQIQEEFSHLKPWIIVVRHSFK